MGNEIDPVRAQSALAVIKQHPGMVLFLTTPALLVVGVVWLLTGSAAWAGLLLVALILAGAGLLYAGMKRR
jgi:hypothetical protein